jgi:hypothetical protein
MRGNRGTDTMTHITALTHSTSDVFHYPSIIEVECESCLATGPLGALLHLSHHLHVVLVRLDLVI